MQQFDPSGNARQQPVSAAEARHWLGLVDTAMNRAATPAQRTNVGMHVTASVLRDLTQFTRAARPERPDLLPLSDQDLLDVLQKAHNHSVRMSDGDREIVKRFAEWRYAVLLQETTDAQRVEVLLYVARALDATIGEYPAHVHDLQQVAGFLAAEWGVQIPPIPKTWEATKVAQAAAQDLETLPRWLRNPVACGWYSGKGTQAKPPVLGAGLATKGSWHDDYNDD